MRTIRQHMPSWNNSNHLKTGFNEIIFFVTQNSSLSNARESSNSSNRYYATWKIFFRCSRLRMADDIHHLQHSHIDSIYSFVISYQLDCRSSEQGKFNFFPHSNNSTDKNWNEISNFIHSSGQCIITHEKRSNFVEHFYSQFRKESYECVQVFMIETTNQELMMTLWKLQKQEEVQIL